MFYIDNHAIFKKNSFYSFFFFPFQSGMPFISFSCLTALPMTSNTVLNRSGKRALSSLISFLNLRRKLSVFHHDTEFNSVAQSYLALCDPMDFSMPGFPVHHQIPRLTQTHVHRVSDVIQPSHLLSSPSLSGFNLSQYQGLFQ